MRKCFMLVGFVVGAFGWSNAALAQLDPLADPPAAVERLSSYDQLFDLGSAIRDLPTYGDNVFAYDRRKQEIVAQAASLEGTKIEFAVEVERVTIEEVLVRVQSAGRTRVVLFHRDPPWFGNLHTLTYASTPSARWTDMLAQPVALRIGREMPLALAQRVRRGDPLLVRGTVKSLRLWIDGAFHPTAFAVITDWTVAPADPDIDPRNNE